MAATRETFDGIVDAATPVATTGFASALKRVSTAGWMHAIVVTLFVGATVFSSAFIDDYSLNAIGARMAWLNIAAIALCSFAATLCMTRWRSPSTRLLGLFLGVFTIYQIGAVASYSPTHRMFVVISYLTWPAISLCFVFWVRVTLHISAATPTDDVPGRGFSAGLVERWQRLQGRPRRFPNLSISPLEPLAVWAPAALFTVLGFIPGLLTSYGGRQKAWRGWSCESHLGFVFFAVWGFLITVACAVLLFAFWRRRALHVLPGVYERARWAPRGATVLAVFLLFAFASTLGLWPEPFYDFLIAVCAVPYALLTIDADSYLGTGATYSSLRQRLLAAALWCGITLALVAVVESGSDPVVQGILAATVAAVLPVGLFIGRALIAVEEMVPSRPAPVESGECIAVELAAPTTAPTSACLSLDALERTRRMLAEIDGSDLKVLIGGLPGPSGRKRSETRDPRSDPRLRAFVRGLPALDCSLAWEVRLMRLNKLIYETARPRVGYDVGSSKNDPGRWRTLAAYCLLRLDPGDLLIGRFEREERLRLRIWLKGERTGLSFYDDLEPLDERALRAKFRELAGEEVAQRRKKVMERALDANLKQVLEHWRTRAEHALGERLPAAFETNLTLAKLVD